MNILKRLTQWDGGLLSTEAILVFMFSFIFLVCQPIMFILLSPIINWVIGFLNFPPMQLTSYLSLLWFVGVGLFLMSVAVIYDTYQQDKLGIDWKRPTK